MARGRAGDVLAAAPNVSTYAPELRVGQLVDRAGIRLFGLHRVGDEPSRRSPSSNEFSDLADGQIEDAAIAVRAVSSARHQQKRTK